MAKTHELHQLLKFIIPSKIKSTHVIMSGGRLLVNEDNKEEFIRTYLDMINNGFKLDICEKQQNSRVRRICLDFDLKMTNKLRNYPKRIFGELVNTCLMPNFEKYFMLNDNQQIKYAVFVREQPYISNNVIRDGFHVVFNIKMNQRIWKKLVTDQFQLIEIFLRKNNVHFTNKIDNVIDNGFINGSTPWTLYGSDKPDNFYKTTPYKLIDYITATYNKSLGQFSFDYTPETEIKNYSIEQLYNLNTISDSQYIQTID